MEEFFSNNIYHLIAYYKGLHSPIKILMFLQNVNWR